MRVELQGHKVIDLPIILDSAVESRKSAQALDAPRKLENILITNKVTTKFSIFLCTPISYTASSRLTADSRFNPHTQCALLLPRQIMHRHTPFSRHRIGRLTHR